MSNKLIPQLLAVLSAQLFGVVASGTPAAHLDYDPATARAVYDRSPDLPDGDAFLALMGAARSLQRSSALAWIESGTGLAASDAEAFLDRLLGASAAFSADFEAAAHRLICAPGRSLSTDAIYSLFDAMDDLRTALAAQHLARLKGALGRQRGALLEQWVAVEKLSIVEVKTRHKAAYEKAGVDPHNQLAAICEQFAPPAGQ